MKIEVAPYIGQHCESTATGTLLRQIGIDLSEPILFGVGEGLGFIFWNMKTMDFPFIGGRIKPDLLTRNIAKNLGLQLNVSETSSKEKAWREVKRLLDAGKAVGLKLDCYHLEYFSNPIHFAGHYVAMIGYDQENAVLVDTAQQGSLVSSSLKSLELARSEKGPMSSKNLYYTLASAAPIRPLNHAVVEAIRSNASEYLNPPIKNISFKGIEKTATEILKWFDRSSNIQEEFSTSAMLMERAGTGGAIFRNFYRDFLAEAFDLTGIEIISQAHKRFTAIAEDWSNVISLFENVAALGERKYVEEASDLLRNISQSEKQAMELLSEI